MSKPNDALISYSILNVHWDESSHGYLDIFVPFLAHCLEKQKSQNLSSDSLRECVEAEFGLAIPINAMTTLTNVLEEHSLVERRNGALRILKNQFDSTAIESTRRTAAREFRQLVVGMVTFSQEELEQNITQEEAREALVVDHPKARKSGQLG